MVKVLQVLVGMFVVLANVTSNAVMQVNGGTSGAEATTE